MSSATYQEYTPTSVPHPGAMVAEYLEFNSWSQRDLARRTGLTPKTISEICNEKAPITPVTALALEKVFQRPAHLWLNLQRQFDEAIARKKVQQRASSWNDWTQKFPLKQMREWGYIETDAAGGVSDVDALLSFFGVTSPEGWDSVWEASRIAYRQTRSIKTSVEAISAWVRATEIAASMIPTGEYDEKLLWKSIPTIRELTLKRAEKIVDPLQSLCAAAGVSVVFVPALPRTGISGCARWLHGSKPLIGLSLRYKTDDQLWFTFFHELGHLLLHRRKHVFVLDNAVNDLSDDVVDPTMQQEEDEANRFATDTLIPAQALESFIARGSFGNDDLKSFASEVGVAPGILVGRLQHDGILERYQGTAFFQRLDFGRR